MSHGLTAHSEEVPLVKLLHLQLLLVHLRVLLMICVSCTQCFWQILQNGRAQLQMLQVMWNKCCWDSLSPWGHSLLILSSTLCVCCTHKLTIAGRGAVSLGHPTVSLRKLQALCGSLSSRDSAEHHCCAHYFPVTCFHCSECAVKRFSFGNYFHDLEPEVSKYKWSGSLNPKDLIL